MADPISLAAVAGLIFAGRALSNKSEPEPPVVTQTATQAPPAQRESMINDDVPSFVEEAQFEPRLEYQSKREMKALLISRTNKEVVVRRS